MPAKYDAAQARGEVATHEGKRDNQFAKVKHETITAKFTALRKMAYLAAHPQTKTGGAPGKAGGGKVATAKDAKLAPFVEDTASKTGQSKRAVARDVARAEALAGDIDRVIGMSLDKGIELDALARMPTPERQAIIKRAAGRASARR